MKHKEPQHLRRLLGMPRKPCDPLTYSGGGRIDVCIACLIEPPNFKRHIAGIAAIRAQGDDHAG